MIPAQSNDTKAESVEPIRGKLSFILLRDRKK